MKQVDKMLTIVEAYIEIHIILLLCMFDHFCNENFNTGMYKRIIQFLHILSKISYYSMCQNSFN